MEKNTNTYTCKINVYEDVESEKCYSYLSI